MTDTMIEPDPDRFVSIADAARHVDLSPWTIRDRIRSGALTAYKTGRKHNAAVRVRLRDVEAMLTPIAPTEV